MKTIYLFLATLFLFACNKEDLITDAPDYGETATIETTGSQRSLSDPHLTTQLVNGKRRVYWSDGVQAVMSHADSPEGGLNPSWYTQDAQYSRAVARRGINARTWTLRGDDVTSIQPGDRNKMQQWKTQFTVFINACKEKGTRPICILYIGERTNFNRTLSQYQSWLSLFAEVMKEGEDITGFFILGIEEVGQSWSDNQVSAWWNPLNAYIKSIMPRSITMLHNNPGKKFWRATSPALQVDVIHVQETSIGNMEASANDALSRGFAIHLHEWYGAIKASQSDATNISKLNQQLAVSERTGCKCSGIFANDIDTQRPDTNKLKAVHIHQGNYFYGSTTPPDDTIVTPPPLGSITVEYSKVWNKNPAYPLTAGTALTQGGYWIFVRTATAPVRFELKKGTSVVRATTDATAPFDLNGSGNQWLQKGFTYTLTVSDGAGQGAAVRFTVQ